MNIIQWDYSIFEWINTALSSPILDWILPWIREAYFWLPLYLFIISFVFFNFGTKAYWFVLFFGLTVGSADIISSRIVKPSVKRIRPCNTEGLMVVERVHCGAGYSFTSTHATNHFALATFLIFTLGIHFNRIKPLVLLWAAAIAFSQVYVGVHFPLDVIAGAILGIVIGKFWSLIFQDYYGYTLKFDDGIH